MKKIIVTKEGLLRAKKEREECLTRRIVILEAIDEARALGDLRENSEYHEAKNLQAMNEAKISELELLIHQSEVVDTDVFSGKRHTVTLGSTVKILTEEGKEKTYRIVGYNEANPNAGHISNESPIARSLMGHREGDTVHIPLPNRSCEYTIIEIQ
jgi:transcription elongation factor GreA